MAKDNKKIGLNPGLKAAGPVLSRAEAQVLAEAKNKDVGQVMSRAVERGIGLGSALVNSYNRGPGASPFTPVPENLAGIAGLQMQKGQAYFGSSATTTPGGTTYNPIVLPRQAVRQQYAQTTTSPGGSTTPLVPGFEINPATNETPVPGQVPASPSFSGSTPTPEQAQNVANLQKSVRTRAEKIADFEERLKAAEEKTKQLRADRAAIQAATAAQDSAALQAERAKRAEDEAAFERRLSDTVNQYQSDRQQVKTTPEADRQALMIDEFNRARRKITNERPYDMDRFRNRFGEEEPLAPAPGTDTGITSTEEGGVSPITYQELLNRLKQYRQGI
jgi:hypothetical protein